jgi:DNA mismatch repair protein MLH1
MLREYFSLGITVEGMVDSLPLLIHDCTPNLDKLPLFLMRLGPQVSSLHVSQQQQQILSQLAIGQLEQ